MTTADKQFTLAVFYHELISDPMWDELIQKGVSTLMNKIIDHNMYPLLDQITMKDFCEIIKPFSKLKVKHLETIIEGIRNDAALDVVNDVYKVVLDAQEKAKKG